MKDTSDKKDVKININLIVSHCINPKLELAVHNTVKHITEPSNSPIFIDSQGPEASCSSQQMDQGLPPSLSVKFADMGATHHQDRLF